MKGILFLPNDRGIADQIKDLLEAMIPGENLEVFRSLETFSQRFRQPLDEMDIAVLLATNHEEFANLFSIQHLLKDRRIILIAPDQKEETVALAHRLRPRHLTSVDDDLSTVPMVLSKMLALK